MTDDRVAAVSVLAGTAATVLCVLADAPQPLRAVVVGVFMLVAPGAAVLLWTRGWPALVVTTAVLSASVAIDVLLSTALFYLGWWSPARVLALLAVLCTACAAARLRASDRIVLG